MDIPVEIERPLPTENTEVVIEKTYEDFAFLFKDGTGIHMEEETDISRDDLYRFISYNADYSRKYKTDFLTAIITHKEPKLKEIISKSICFKPLIIDLSKRDGDALLEKLTVQLNNGEELNELELIYLSLYNSKDKTIAQLLNESIKLLSRSSYSKDKKEKIFALSIALADKFLGKCELSQLWEAYHMMVEDLKWVQVAKEKYTEQGRSEGVLSAAKEFIKNGFSPEQVANILKLPIETVKNL